MSTTEKLITGCFYLLLSLGLNNNHVLLSTIIIFLIVWVGGWHPGAVVNCLIKMLGTELASSGKTLPEQALSL